MGNICRKICCCFSFSGGSKRQPPSTAPASTEKKMHETTILVVGNIAVGKTTLINCLLHGKKQNDVKTQRTNAVDQVSKIMMVDRQTTLKLNFVDLAGNMTAKDLIRQQAKFSYILLCYAINKQSSYQQLDDWVEAINQNERGERTPITLVATKCDLVNDRAISEDQGFNYVAQLNAECKQSLFPDGQRCQIFRETSAYEDVESVTSLFKDITMEIVKNKVFD